MKYKTLVACSHSVTGKLIQPNHLIDVEHLTPDEVLMLVDMQVLAPVSDDYVFNTGPAEGELVQLSLPDDTMEISVPSKAGHVEGTAQ